MNPPSPPESSAAAPNHQRVVCFVNGVYTKHIGGGDIYFTHIIRGVVDAGFPVHFFGGHALEWFLKFQNLPLNLTLTDRRIADLGDASSFGGQIRLFGDYVKRVLGTLPGLKTVRREDIAFVVSDFWWDTIPLLLCRSTRKILYLGMMAPSLKEVIFRTRADVPRSRIASLHYWATQQFSLRCFRFCRKGFVTYGHPEMRDYLLRFGYRESQMTSVPNAIDVPTVDKVPSQSKQFDIAWTGRVHAQKGIDDLLGTLKWLGERLPDFRAAIIGKSKDTLEPIIREMGLTANVTFSGLVSEEEKFRLLKASRVFVMPSHYESWGIVVGEAVAAGTAVVAYELQCYPSVFGKFVRYVKPFDKDAFNRSVEDEVRNQRAGKSYLAGMDLEKLKRSLSWQASQKAFNKLLAEVEKVPV
ncbi:MAG TPA: glycosyltransferase family 4 protein [Verrucomicrobiae bacterium]|jgi:glycosyltransferase involved in cell wall biosynthesis|nr:glycosyltransferase family 4 protein [Verrucomicrobiae bacterium]